MARWNAALLLPLFAIYVAGNQENNVTVTCDNNTMTVSLKKQGFPGLNVTMLHLLRGWCRADDTPTHMFLSTALNDCGTTFIETENSLVFSNEVQSDVGQVLNTITRDHDFDLPFNCSYSRNKFLSLSFNPDGIVSPPGEEGFGDLTFRMDFYPTSSYDTPYNGNDYPLTKGLNEDLYLKYSVESSVELTILAVTCKVTKHGNYYSSPAHTYYLIQDGCNQDTTVVHEYDGNRSFQPISFKTLRFLGNYDTVYFHVEVLACHRNTPNSRCSQGCVNNRKRRKREATTRDESEQLQPSSTKTYTIKRGPIVIQEKQETGDTGLSKQQAAVIGGSTAAGAFVVLAVIALIVLFVKYRIARLMLNRNKIGDMYTTQDQHMSQRNAYIQEDDMVDKDDSM